MSDHQHESYEVHDVATNSDVRGAFDYIEGLRHDLGQAEERIRQQDTEIAQLRRDVADLREQVDPEGIDGLKLRVQTLASVLSAHLAASGLDASVQALGEIGDPK